MRLTTSSGTVQLQAKRARLATNKGTFTLIPFPRELRLPARTKEEAGRDLFRHLAGQDVSIQGTASEDTIFNARVADPGASVEDVQIAPGSRDRFSAEIEFHFQKDSREIAAKLNDAGIRTISALYHRIKDAYEIEVAAFSKYLGVRKERIKSFVSALEADTENRALVSAAPRQVVARGVNLDLLSGPPKTQAPPQPPKLPKSALTPNLPSKVDLTVHVTPVRDQGLRSTCVAHAAVVALEAELIKKGLTKNKADLSEQYLYWGCKVVDGAPNQRGTFIRYAAEVALNGVAGHQLPPGVCAEKAWPYSLALLPRNEGHSPLPQPVRKVFTDLKQHKITRYSSLKPNSIGELKRALYSGHCVALSVYTYHFWTDDFAWREGVISLPFAIEPDGAHAICLVGYQDDDATHGDGYFIFKNSWGLKWGSARPDMGFGSLPYRYVIKEAIEAYTFEV